MIQATMHDKAERRGSKGDTVFPVYFCDPSERNRTRKLRGSMHEAHTQVLAGACDPSTFKVKARERDRPMVCLIH